MLNIILILMLCTVIFAVFLTIYLALRIGVVPMPSSNKERGIVTTILGDYRDIEKIIDLGSGWGGLARILAFRFPRKEIFAIEKSPVPHFTARILSFMSGYPNINHRIMDFKDLHLRNNEAYICYLSGPAMRELRKKFETDQPGKGVLISIAFAMPGWTPTRVEYGQSILYSPVYLYEF